MKPYKNIKLIECPDVAEIQKQGRHSRVGRVPRGENKIIFKDGLVVDKDGHWHGKEKTVHNDRGYVRAGFGKRAVRRQLKKHNKRWRKGMSEVKRRILLEFLWNFMKRDPIHKDRVLTGWGSKTRQGLVASIESIVEGDGSSDIRDGHKL